MLYNHHLKIISIMKKSIIILCAVVSALSCQAKVGDIIATGNINYQVICENSLDNQAIVLSPQSSDISTATVGSSVANAGVTFTVTGIHHKAFENCKNLKNVTLPTSITWIGAYSFRGCANLVEIVIPAQVTSIGRMAFADCVNLSKVTMTSNLEQMGDDVFFGCTALKTVILPQGFTKMGNGMFERCTSLSAANIVEGATSISDYAYAGCALTSVAIPTGTEEIGEGTFSFNDNLTAVSIPNSMKTIGSGAFMNAASLAHVTLPSWITSLGEGEGGGLFDGCNKMTEVTIPAFVENVGDIATAPTTLTSVYVMGNHIPEGLASLPKTNSQGVPVTIYVKRSVYEEKYADGEWNGIHVDYRIPITMVNAKGNTVKYKTLCRDFDIDFSETNVGLEDGVGKLSAYIAPDADEGLGIVFMEEINYIPSRLKSNEDGYQGEDEYVGIVMKGTPGETYYYMMGENDYTQGASQWLLEDATAAANASPWYGNRLRGANDTKWVQPTETDASTGNFHKNYGLNNNAFRVYSTMGWLGYNKAYLSIPHMNAQANITMMFTDADGSTDSITLEEFASQCDDGEAFDLLGRRVKGHHKGIVIKDGQKRIR